MTAEPVDWNREAVEVANDAFKHLHEEPIGAYQPLENLTTTVLFGNGETRYDKDRTAQRAVELLRRRFAGLHVMELGFGLDSEAKSTWSIIVKAPGQVIDEQRLDRLGQALRKAYRIARKQE